MHTIRAFLRKPVPLRVRLVLFLIFLYGMGMLTPLFNGDIFFVLHMPRSSYTGTLSPLSQTEIEIRQKLYSHVYQLSVSIGERNMRKYENLERASAYIADRLRGMGYDVQFQEYTVAGKTVRNIEATLKGHQLSGGILVVGAHYDSVNSPAANDNGTGVAALLELARLIKNENPSHTLRLVAFTNEEPPFFQTRNMGSFVYAKECHKRKERVIGMFSLETIGYYSDAPHSQHYPFPLNYFYPDKGNFIAFVGNSLSQSFVEETVAMFRQTTHFPSEGAAISEYVRGVGWSDHWSFWQFGYPALMVTDTAPYRYNPYHTSGDTIEKIDFDKMARVVSGLEKVIRSILK